MTADQSTKTALERLALRLGLPPRLLRYRIVRRAAEIASGMNPPGILFTDALEEEIVEAIAVDILRVSELGSSDSDPYDEAKALEAVFLAQAEDLIRPYSAEH
jgi:hypothetical protein